ncbi:MAG: PSD1 domain-containing protein [Acidobacteria bacterium]|nr:PSD1 domain-containing protein [Acidobacteriota bacterium]
MTYLRLGLVLALAVVCAHAQQNNDRHSIGVKASQIIAANCVGCHGAPIKNAGLDLRKRDTILKGGERGAAVSPGNPELSRIYRQVAHLDAPHMPPGKKLSEEEIQTLKTWIERGVPYEDILDQKEEEARAALAKLEDRPITPAERKWWAFQKVVRPAGMKSIDEFLLDTMRKKGLTPSPAADKRALARRAYLDLTGLPPTIAQLKEFVDDQRPDAYNRLVDKLLDSPHYGERWARHWLDLVRFSDSGGFEYDRERDNAWRYRDYVIRAFNSDKPYDRFLKEQLAGDELYPNSVEARVATGFLRLGVENNIRTEQTRMDELDDIVVTTANSLLGVTVGCARCHNHKFDPIPQKDYYRMQAVFFGTKAEERPLVSDEELKKHKDAVKAIEELQRPIRKEMRAVEQPTRDKIIAKRKSELPDYMRLALATPLEKRTDGQKLNANQVEKTLENIREEDLIAEMPLAARAKRDLLQSQIDDLDRQKPRLDTVMAIMENSKDAPASYFLHRGNIGQKGSKMAPGVLSAATDGEWSFPAPPADAKSSFRRAGFAEWITSPDNPLTARVMVNRIWQNHFGEGIVRTPSNFGKMGERPSHPELLDYLASEFVQSGWSVKHVQRLIMKSAAYQMASDDIEANIKIDADNRFVWRMARRRVEGEVIRDAVLATAGTLDGTVGGPAVYPYIDPALFQSSSKRTWNGKAVNDPSTYRRSVYVFSKRTIPLPMLETFDRPDTMSSCARRNRSTIAPQALILMNNEFIGIQAKHFAQRLEREAGPDTTAQVKLAYELALSREPKADELAKAIGFIQSYPQGLVDFSHALFNINEFVYIP